MKPEKVALDRFVWTRGKSPASEMEPMADEDGRRNLSKPAISPRAGSAKDRGARRARVSNERGSYPDIALNHCSINSLLVLRQKLAS